MKLLLCKNVEKLGIVGDIVDVAAGYARNYLVPYGLATEPTQANIRALAKARRGAEKELAEQRTQLERLRDILDGVEVTIRAKANEEGVLYGSVGPREVAAALEEEGHYVKPEQVALSEPIKQLDSVAVELRLTEDLRSSIKVWVVRDKVEGEPDMEEAHREDSGREADGNGDGGPAE